VKLNRSNPQLRSPVADIVTNAGEGNVGRIAVRDANGRSRRPNQPAPPDEEQEQADLLALEAGLSSTGNIRDAWALYNVRIASRRQEKLTRHRKI
jgi:hypothetical protein